MSLITRRGSMVAVSAWLMVRPAAAEAPEMDAAVRSLTGGAAIRAGRVSIDLPELVENGNAVPITIAADSPMTPADHVVTLALFTERNPQPEVAVFRFGANAGRARVTTRMRLATSGRVVALARMSDGQWWKHEVDVIVTLAACVES